jgi:hypothetical protein
MTTIINLCIREDGSVRALHFGILKALLETYHRQIKHWTGLAKKMDPLDGVAFGTLIQAIEAFFLNQASLSDVVNQLLETNGFAISVGQRFIMIS